MTIPTDDPDLQALIAQAVADELARRDDEARQAALDAAAADEEAAKTAQQEADATQAAALDERARWEGHTHAWGKPKNGLIACSECPLVTAEEG